MSSPKSESEPPAKRVLIVDDHPMMRQGLVQLLSEEKGLAVCGEASDCRTAIDAVEKLQPDLVLADITLPDRNGLELIKDMIALRPGVLVLVISMHEESLYAERALRAGARGYVMKQEGGVRLLEAIREVLLGRIAVSAKMSARILEAFSGHRPRGDASPVELLTDREFEVFQLIGQGRSTREIAERLQLSAKTVEAHRANIKTKLGFKSAPELIAFAAKWAQSSGES